MARAAVRTNCWCMPIFLDAAGEVALRRLFRKATIAAILLTFLPYALDTSGCGAGNGSAVEKREILRRVAGLGVGV